jgi:hypothetical protein
VHADAQVKGLQAAAAGVAAFQGFLQPCSSCRCWPMERPISTCLLSSSAWRMPSPPGTSPTPVWPALSCTSTMLRVK